MILKGRRVSPPFPISVLLRRVRKERDRAGTLEGRGQRSLVPGARARHAARQDLAAVADKAAQARDLLVVDVLDLLDAEAAHLAMLALRASRPAARALLAGWSVNSHSLTPKRGSRPGRRRAARRPERGCRHASAHLRHGRRERRHHWHHRSHAARGTARRWR